MSGAVADWDDPLLRIAFRQGVANGLQPGVTKGDVRIDSIAGASVAIAFTVFETASYGGSEPLVQRLNDAATVAQLVAAVEATTGHTVEVAPDLTGAVQVDADGGRTSVPVPLNRSAADATIGASVAAVAVVALAAGAAYWALVVRRRLRRDAERKAEGEGRGGAEFHSVTVEGAAPARG